MSLDYTFLTALLSEDGKFRYSLTRSWTTNIKPSESVTFVMLNPSTADANNDDPTIRRCVNFAKSWGFTTLYVVNLFAFRATDPKILQEASNYHVGDPFNARTQRLIFAQSEQVVCAWGANPVVRKWDALVEAVQSRIWDSVLQPMCLELTKEGYPRHPLYVRKDIVFSPYDPTLHQEET